MAEPTIVVGRIAKAHGVIGEVAVLVLSEVPDRFADGAALWLEDGRELTVSSSRRHGQRLLVRFRQISDRAAADELRGRLLVVPESMLPELPDDSYWPHELEGCEVVTDAGRSLGTLVEVVANPANDLWVAKDGASETMVPAIRDVIVSVDLAERRVVVREVPGITAPG